MSLSVQRGTVLGLIGENGAGKSTLSSIIAGNVKPDSGHMTIDGAPYSPANPAVAIGAGVVLIHQEIQMVQYLSVAENIFLGRLPIRNGRVDRETMNQLSADALGRLGISVDPRTKVQGLSIAMQQGIEIAKALTRKPNYIIFDEPSSSLTENETDRVMLQINTLREEGAGIIYISHRLEEVRQISDQIVCMRDGVVVKEWEKGDTPKDELVRAMVGRDLVFSHPTPSSDLGEVMIEVKNLTRRGVFEDINFEVRKGEVLGIAGLVGAGRSEVVRVISGADRGTGGEIFVEGKIVLIKNPADAIKVGIVTVPEDRKRQGLNLTLDYARNIISPWERIQRRFKIVTNSWVDSIAHKSKDSFEIRGSLSSPVLRLSGGNQQKVLLAKWLVREPKVLILDEPTRGVDVGAKEAIYKIIRDCTIRGVAVILVSSELQEVLGLAHRVLVMSGGRQVGLLEGADATSENIIHLAVPQVSVS